MLILGETPTKKLLPVKINEDGSLFLTAPTPSGGATELNQTNGLQKTQIVDNVGANITMQKASSKVAIHTALLGSGNTEINSLGNNGDGIGTSASSNNLTTVSYSVGFNGTTWDRIRAGFSGAVSSVVGYLNVLPMLRYNATRVLLTSGQWLGLQADRYGSLWVNTTRSVPSLTSTAVALTANTSTVILATDTERDFLYIDVPSSNTSSIWINFFGGTATIGGATMREFPPGTKEEFSTKLAQTAITAISATATNILLIT